MCFIYLGLLRSGSRNRAPGEKFPLLVIAKVFELRISASKGTHAYVGWLVPLILRGVVDLPMRTRFNLGGNAR